jgi:hypothetical protein
MIDGIHYLNCGDWVESATAIVETHGGELKVIRWGVTQTRADVRSAEDGNLAAAA